MLCSKCPRNVLILLIYPYVLQTLLVDLGNRDSLHGLLGPRGTSVNTCPFMHTLNFFLPFGKKKQRLPQRRVWLQPVKDPGLMTARAASLSTLL